MLKINFLLIFKNNRNGYIEAKSCFVKQFFDNKSDL